MSIGVQSYPELYTMLLGWQLYDEIWTILSQTGLAFLPFIGIVLRNIGQPYTSQETKDAGSTSLRRMELDFLITLLLIFFGVSPALNVDPTLVSYTPVCQTNGEKNTYHPGSTGTTYDTAFTIPQGDLRAPIWWYAVMAMSEGITAGANTLVSCAPNLRSLVTQVDMTKINDPELKQQVQQFEQDCFIPARTQYLADVNTHASTLPAIDATVANYGAEDTEWVGSHSYAQTYYKNLKAAQPIKGFAYNAEQDINADTNTDNPPAYGTPTCDVWWNDSQNGLKQRLYNQLSPDVQTVFQTLLSDPKTQDNVVRNVIFHSENGYQAAANTIGDTSYSHLAAGLGTWFQSLESYPKIYAAAEAAPIIQSLLILMVYAFLPLALVFTGYKPGSFIAGAVMIFSLIFWSFIWNLVSWTDTSLMNALYGSNFFAQHAPNAMLVDMITGTMIIVAPLFWFSFMGAMGILAGDLVSKAASSLGGVGDQAAKQGASFIKTVASEVIGQAVSSKKK